MGGRPAPGRRRCEAPSPKRGASASRTWAPLWRSPTAAEHG